MSLACGRIMVLPRKNVVFEIGRRELTSIEVLEHIVWSSVRLTEKATLQR